MFCRLGWKAAITIGAAGHRELVSVAERRTGPDDEPAPHEVAKAGVERDASERNHQLHPRQGVPLGIQVHAAGEHLLGCGLVVGRRAPHRCRDERVTQRQAIVWPL